MPELILPRPPHRDRLTNRIRHLPGTSRQLYRIEHYSSLPMATATILVVVVAMVAVGAGYGFPMWWFDAFTTTTSAVTLVMVFAIQHTTGREQTAIQRKLDELLRAVPEAEKGLMLLEEAPDDELHDVEIDQRAVQRQPDSD